MNTEIQDNQEQVSQGSAEPKASKPTENPQNTGNDVVGESGIKDAKIQDAKIIDYLVSKGLDKVIQKFDGNWINLAEGYKNAEEKIHETTNKLQEIAAKKATDFTNEEWGKFAEVLQDIYKVPQSPDGYNFEELTPGELTESAQMINDFLDTEQGLQNMPALTKAYSHKIGLNTEQAKQVFALVANTTKLMAESLKSDYEYKDAMDIKELERMYQLNHPDSNIALNKRRSLEVNVVKGKELVAQEMGITVEQLDQIAKDRGYLNSPERIYALERRGREYASTPFQGMKTYKEKSKDYSMMSPHEAAVELENIQGTKEYKEAFNFADPNYDKNPTFKQLRDNVGLLVKIKNGK